MTWFKVDDGLHSHRKWLATSMAARGLWVTAGSWCADQLTDGHVPAHVLRQLGGRPRDAAELVRNGLWDLVDDGWVFHQWESDGGGAARNPTRADVERERAAARDRQRRARDKATGSRRDTTVSHSEVTAHSQRESRRESRPPVSRPPVSHPPDPTRPDPYGDKSPPGLTLVAAEPAGEGTLVDQAIRLAAERYAQHETTQGRKVDNPAGLGKWWRQQNGTDARKRAERLLGEHTLTGSQLADALLSPTDPPWLASYRKRPGSEPFQRPDLTVVQSIAAQARAQLRQPGAAPSREPT